MRIFTPVTNVLEEISFTFSHSQKRMYTHLCQFPQCLHLSIQMSVSCSEGQQKEPAKDAGDPGDQHGDNFGFPADLWGSFLLNGTELSNAYSMKSWYAGFSFRLGSHIYIF